MNGKGVNINVHRREGEKGGGGANGEWGHVQYPSTGGTGTGERKCLKRLALH